MGRQRLRVLHLQHAIYPYRTPLFEELAREFDITIYSARSKKRFRRWDTSLASDVRFNSKVLPGLSFGPLTVNYTLPFHLLHQQFDVYTVAALDLITLPQALLLLGYAKVRGRPFVLVDEFFETPWYGQTNPRKLRLNRLTRRLLYRHIDAFVAWNKPAADYIAQYGVRREAIFTGPVFYPKELLDMSFGGGRADARKALALEPSDAVILTVSYLQERKGMDYLIRAFRQLDSREAKLIILGEGDAEPTLRLLARGDDRITFAGHREGGEKCRYYAAADIFVLPSLYDPWGLVVNEAMYYGLPIIATNTAGCVDYLVRDNGFVVAPANVDALAKALGTLLGDAELRHRMGEKSRVYVEDCNVAAMKRPFVDAMRYVTRSNHGA